MKIYNRRKQIKTNIRNKNKVETKQNFVKIYIRRQQIKSNTYTKKNKIKPRLKLKKI